MLTGGWSVTLVGPSARCQQRQNLALPNARRGTLHPSREKERNIFSFFFFLFGKHVFLVIVSYPKGVGGTSKSFDFFSTMKKVETACLNFPSYKELERSLIGLDDRCGVMGRKVREGDRCVRHFAPVLGLWIIIGEAPSTLQPCRLKIRCFPLQPANRHTPMHTSGLSHGLKHHE